MANQAENSGFSTPGKNHHHHHPSSSISKVRVIVRLRPFLPQELSSRNGTLISCVSLQQSNSSSDEVTVLLKDHETSRNECYKLDAFFGHEDNNVSQIYEREVRPLIPGIFHGYNATIFAYGATRSGKTFTMQGSDQLPGLMPLAVSNILSMCKCTGSKIVISYYEIYLDKCYDLLDTKEKEVLIWNDKDGQIHLKGLAQIEVSSMDQFHEIFSSALQRRKVAHTGLNDVSSRSHGVLGITISTPSHDSIVIGKLNLIDLAGNEDNKRTGNEGIRLQESAKINQSLFALSNVIYALNNGKSRIPYRESKLTRILQDSLGGTSRALMVACLNPGEYQESVHTVSLAARSRHVSNFVNQSHKNANSNVKVDMEAKLVAWLETKGKTKSAKKTGFCHSPFLGKTPCSVKSSIKFNTCSRTNETKVIRRSPCTAGRNLFNGGGGYPLHSEAQIGDISEPNLVLPDESTFCEEEATAVNKKIKALESPLREALSPINTNTGNSHSVPSDVIKTPKMLFSTIAGDDENDFQVLGTPLHKFTARSSRLKSCLVQEYIEFLNTASREELMELKGIGEKIAEYIFELRQTSPLKSLGDLEKIGLSSKQVHNMFGMAARGLLANLVHNA